MNVLLWDADILVYRCGFAADRKKWIVKKNGLTIEEFTNKKELNSFQKQVQLEDGDELNIVHEFKPEPLEFALNNINTVVSAVNNLFPDSTNKFFLTGKDNFREKIATMQPYKGNRDPNAKPFYYKEIRDFIINRYEATVVDGQEADDEIGIQHCLSPEDSVIVSIDKDLDTVPGRHYNWVTKAEYYLNEAWATKNFYKQLLTGDSTDNVPGIPYVGSVTAERILKEFTKPKSLYQCVLSEYTKRFPDGFMGLSPRNAVLEIGRLLYIRQQRDELWSPP